MTTPLERFQTLLKKLFQFDNAELDFGIYRIMNDKGYVLLDGALERQFARVTEISGAGSVPELAFENSSAEKILLVDGDELVGAKQNRVVNLSILVRAGKRIVIPVTCVEQGRWKYRSDAFSSSNSALFSKARASKMQHVSASLRQSGTRRSDQGAIWAAVADKADSLGLQSETMAMHDLFEARTRDLGRYTEAFRAEQRQHHHRRAPRPPDQPGLTTHEAAGSLPGEPRRATVRTPCAALPEPRDARACSSGA